MQFPNKSVDDPIKFINLRSADNDDYYVDPPSPSPELRAATQRIVNWNNKKRRTEVVATKSKPVSPPATNPTPLADSENPNPDDDDVPPHQWTTRQARTLIQIRTSDEIDGKFRTTKKGHKFIWLTVSKKLQSMGIQVDRLQVQPPKKRVHKSE